MPALATITIARASPSKIIDLEMELRSPVTLSADPGAIDMRAFRLGHQTKRSLFHFLRWSPVSVAVCPGSVNQPRRFAPRQDVNPDFAALNRATACRQL